MKRLLCGLAAWGLLMGLTGPAKAQYMFTEIDFPGSTYTVAYGINDAGQIVGYSFLEGGTEDGFLLDVDGTYTTLDPPGATSSIAYGINDAGQIVGTYNAHGQHGFLRDVDGSYTTLDPPGSTSSFAYGINDAGQIVGY